MIVMFLPSGGLCRGCSRALTTETNELCRILYNSNICWNTQLTSSRAVQYYELFLGGEKAY